jgi:hypothetical protein
MVAIRDAVKISMQNLQEIFPETSMPGLRLEEVMLSDDEQKWDVTVSYLNPDYDLAVSSAVQENNALQHFLGARQKVPIRLYKTVTIGAEQGKLFGIRNDWETIGR